LFGLRKKIKLVIKDEKKLISIKIIMLKMKIFENFTKKQIDKLKKDTSNFYIGSPEAEAENTLNSIMQLDDVFEDYLDVIYKLQSEKFIISGRKGCGKSAIAERIYSISRDDSKYFCDFIKKGDIDIEKITQISNIKDSFINQELIIEWILLIKLVNQLVSNEAISNQKGIQDLKIFLKKNSGFVDIKSHQIEEILQSNGWEISVDYFKRFLSAKFGNRFDIKSGKAPFYKLLPHLKATIKDLFINTLNRDNFYILIFDDLDIGFNSKDENNVKTLLNIIRIVKEYNISFFGKEGINAKVILLLRDDISRVLINKDADTAKLFSSYEIPLNWYNHNGIYKNEEELSIKKFINKRIKHNFEKNEFDYDTNKPWDSLIDSDPSYSHSSFKYIIDHTLIRPRDLILFFKPLSELKFQIPLSKFDVNTLIGKYSIEFVKELKNELTAHYSSKQIDCIFEVLYNCTNEDVTFGFVEQELKNNGFNESPIQLMELLYDLSIIGNLSLAGKTYFKHWEKDDEVFRFNKFDKIILHFSLRIYCSKRR
jgi:hypothetical protein